MESKFFTSLFGIWFLTTSINGEPNCTTYGGKDIICTASDTEYILAKGLVSGYNEVTGITLRDCRIIDVDYEAFEGDNNLKYIDLSKNQIKNLKLGVLDENLDVTFLNLSHNLIRSFPLGLFDQKPNLEVLDLKGNKLRNFELGVFDPLTNLIHLDLSSNSIVGADLTPYLFDKSQKIRFIDFSRNNMAGANENLLNSLTELDFINLDRCSLKEVPNFATKSNLNTMKHLMLSTNRITKLTGSNLFSSLDNLEILNLAHNMIENIDEEVFYPLKKLKMIVLRNNRLKALPDKLFLSLRALGNIDLANNVIEYVPLNTFRQTPALKNLNLANNKFTYLEANFCLELRNAGVKLNKFYFNDNPWQCACLREVLGETLNYDITYNFSKYNGKRPVCVIGTDFHCRRQPYDNEYFVELYDKEILMKI